jgi:hypothetical protein
VRVVFLSGVKGFSPGLQTVQREDANPLVLLRRLVQVSARDKTQRLHEFPTSDQHVHDETGVLHDTVEKDERVKNDFSVAAEQQCSQVIDNLAQHSHCSIVP